MGQLLQLMRNDGISLAIVIFLGLLSVFSVAIIIKKKRELRLLEAEAARALAFVSQMTHASEVFSLIEHLKLQSTLKALMAEFFLAYERADFVGGRRSGSQESAWRLIDGQIEYGVGGALKSLNSGLMMLSIVATISPLLGLLGTIWGLVGALGGLVGAKGSAHIALVAPGIAGALVTTLLGLVVAIPAVAFYHYLSHRLLTVEGELFTLTEALLARLDRHDTPHASFKPKGDRDEE